MMTILGHATTKKLVNLARNAFALDKSVRGKLRPGEIEPRPDTALTISTADKPRGKGETILIVDDESAMRDVTAQILETFGYKTIAVENGALALAVYRERQNEIAAVLADMNMPVMDGPEMIRELFAINPAVRVIGASGFDLEQIVAKAAEAGVKHYLPKPYTSAILLHTVRTVLDGE